MEAHNPPNAFQGTFCRNRTCRRVEGRVDGLYHSRRFLLFHLSGNLQGYESVNMYPRSGEMSRNCMSCACPTHGTASSNSFCHGRSCRFRLMGDRCRGCGHPHLYFEVHPSTAVQDTRLLQYREVFMRRFGTFSPSHGSSRHGIFAWC